MDISTLNRMLFDWRGRSSRKGFLIASGAILGVEIFGAILIHIGGLSADSAMIVILKAALLWMCGVALAKRLHDIGYSAFWIIGAAAACAGWAAIFVPAFLAFAGLDAIQPGSAGNMILNAGAMAPALASMLWLQLAAGHDGANIHGLAPDESGFSGVMPETAVAPHLTPRPQF